MIITEQDWTDLQKRIERIKSSLQGLQRSLEQAEKEAYAMSIALGKIKQPDALVKQPEQPVLVSWDQFKAQPQAQTPKGKPMLPV